MNPFVLPDAPLSEETRRKIRRARIALGVIVVVVLAVNFAFYLALSKRAAQARAKTPPAPTNSVPAAR